METLQLVPPFHPNTKKLNFDVSFELNEQFGNHAGKQHRQKKSKPLNRNFLDPLTLKLIDNFKECNHTRDACESGFDLSDKHVPIAPFRFVQTTFTPHDLAKQQKVLDLKPNHDMYSSDMIIDESDANASVRREKLKGDLIEIQECGTEDLSNKPAAPASPGKPQSNNTGNILTAMSDSE